MGIKRRDFIKIAGLTPLVGLGAKQLFDFFAPGQAEASVQNLPLAMGKKYGMLIDLSKLNEAVMKACAESCHHLHNVPAIGNQKEEIKWIWPEEFMHAFPNQEHAYFAERYLQNQVLVLCNHCTNPPCCRACPTKATWKREDGVVMMDMHRCIGCRFCMAACPYGARSFNWGDPRKAPKDLNPQFPTNPLYPTRSKGVVEKCNFCAERLAEGLEPVCVEAANKITEQVMIFGDLGDTGSPARVLLREKFSIRRKPELGTEPNIYYII